MFRDKRRQFAKNVLWGMLKTNPTSCLHVKRQYLSSIRNLSSAVKSSRIDNYQLLGFFPSKHRQYPHESSRTLILTSQTVQTTLVNCPSDIIALSFFMWCARQPNYFHQRVAFEAMVHVVSRLTQKFSMVRRILEELNHVGCVTKPQTLLLLLRIFWCGRMYDMVFDTFEEMINCGYSPNTFARNILMDVLFKLGQVDVALRFMEETKLPNFLTFSIAVCNLCNLNDQTNLRIVLRKTLRSGFCLNPETFVLVLNSYCKLGRLEEALQLLGLMKTLGVRLSVNIWSILIDGFCKSGQLDTATYLLSRMVESGCSPNIVTCTSLIKGFLESKMLDEAFEILDTLKSKGCYPDLVLSNVLIDCLSKVGRYDDALDVFFNLQERRLIPDPYTFSSIMSIICSSGQFLLLPLLISGLVIQPDLVMCNTILRYFCNAGYPSGAVEFYNDMIDKGFVPDKYSYAELLSGLCKMGRIHEAVSVYCGIVRSHFGVDAHMHTIIMDGLIKSGNFHSAINFFRQAAAENVPLDVISFTVAINGLLQGGRAGEAYNLFSQMKDIGISPNIHTYNLILSSCCKDRDVKMIKKILKEMSDSRVEMDSYTYELIKGFLYKSHNSSLVLNIFVELWDSGLLPEKMCSLLVERGKDATVVVAHRSKVVTVQDIGSSSSDECCGLAASVG
ncbi:hypothetical protein M9H77_20695 [Catharanthus roseus]|uniref:Uncharacterized protein n=1 Tax=Catharanthus roseus TaxID=4058 RepID=A0ACC0ALQ5_CATRO|nr:hypothetical protein M9H77_20695 [Catharanthus roseus]